LSEILRAVPAARGVLVDLPHVIDTARALVAERGVADRCELIGGSFFESVPAGGDAHVLKWIIHDWNDVDATRILRTVRAAVPRTGRLIVFDRVLLERVREGDALHQPLRKSNLGSPYPLAKRRRSGEARGRCLFPAMPIQPGSRISPVP
jgi:hypothetical protein